MSLARSQIVGLIAGEGGGTGSLGEIAGRCADEILKNARAEFLDEVIAKAEEVDAAAGDPYLWGYGASKIIAAIKGLT
ncbi:hypothetical protein [Streptomyces avermitilis]|uniref:hypothetical protein n=1 Tax=Streptomyces avermitilis TaxID=33903 RepID=UPI0038006CCC